MMRNGQRIIKIEKSKLIETLKKHKENHIVEYENAVKAYKLEAIEQLKVLLGKAEEGKLELRLSLVEPINNTENYDKIISMFEWEVEDIVELTQDEFREYVLNENSFTERAKMSNVMYTGKWF